MPKKEDDPFWDPPEPRLIGQGFCMLLSLAHLLDNPTEISLIGEHNKCGLLRTNIVPTDEEGVNNISE